MLLKNENKLLPLKSAKSGRILIVGVDDVANTIRNCGGGAGQVIPLKEVIPVGGTVEVRAELGADNEVEVCPVADDMSNLAEAKEGAAAAGNVVIMAGPIIAEGDDQDDRNVPKNQNTAYRRPRQHHFPHRHRPRGRRPGAQAVAE